MSVEGAWKDIAYWLNGREFACLDGNYTDELRDRLILAVQAEMPCYDDGWGIGGRHECPSCAAREKLKEAVTA